MSNWSIFLFFSSAALMAVGGFIVVPATMTLVIDRDPWVLIGVFLGVLLLVSGAVMVLESPWYDRARQNQAVLREAGFTVDSATEYEARFYIGSCTATLGYEIRGGRVFVKVPVSGFTENATTPEDLKELCPVNG